jgi:uncharacterized protein involved in response to NO
LLEEVAFGKRWIGMLLLLAAVMNLVRQGCWAPHRACASPRLAIFHVAYGFIVLGFLLTAFSILWDDYDFATGGLHAWAVGSIGTMTLAVMTWASRVYTGRSPSASAGTVVLYGLGLIAGLAWTAAGVYPQWTLVLLPLSGVAWIAAFGGFAVLYGRMLVLPRLD